MSIRATTHRDSGDIVIEVSDDGPGIPAEVVAHLFKPSPSQRRVGYALILGRETMLAHGGSIEVQRTPDPDTHRTTVRVAFPGR